jgi:iron only hydrogenase large subunit-like protein
MQTGKNSIVFTLKAKCRDCYKCLRHCPVHAIGIKDGQAYVDPERCIQCGNCVRICPQNAKTYRNDLGLAKELVKSEKAYVSIAPSFAASYTGWETMRVPSVLRKLGFKKVFETSEAAPLSAKMAKKIMDETNRGGAYTACPVVANYVVKYKPEKLPWLIDISSPMVLHGRALKDAYGSDAKVIFIGPCIAKKGEAEREGNAGAIDAVLTFEELAQWMIDENISLKECEESGFDKIGTQSFSRFFPLPGAMSKSAGMDDKKGEFISASGPENVMELFDFEFSDEKIGAEPLFCSEGCINGPCIGTECNLFERRASLLKYAGEQKEAEKVEVPEIKLKSKYITDEIKSGEISEEAINEVYKNTGKLDESQRLNCGACGYPSCRDMAIAVINGNAEEEMCIPFMRRMAQARGDMLMETTPNGVVIVDDKLRILSTNKAFKKDFLCGDAVIGKEISYLLPVNGFEEIASGKTKLVNNIINCYGKVYHQILYPLPQENKYTGIYSDITEHKLSEKKLESIKKETARQAQMLLENQLEMARQMAEFLGKSTAKSEEIVEKLISPND